MSFCAYLIEYRLRAIHNRTTNCSSKNAVTMLYQDENYETFSPRVKNVKCTLLNKVCYCNTSFFVFTTHIELCKNTHLFMCSPNTPWCVPKTYLKLCLVLVLNFTHFQVCSTERCVLSHVLMCNKAHLQLCFQNTPYHSLQTITQT